jgi:beta-glucanase (GH16 family)
VSLAVDAQKPKYRLVWKENFNGKELRSDRWSKIPRGRSDWNNFMSFDERCYDFSDGKMTLIGLVNDYLPQDTAPYLTGGIYTKDKFSITYGKVEVKARLQGAQGAWPAIWMLPENASWPDGGEIDIMERLNHEAQAYQTVHSYYTYTLKMKEPDNSATAPIRPDKYNVYAVEILSDSLVFSINGRRTFIYPRIETPHKGQFPFGTPFYLLIDMQIEGQWVGKARPEELPVKMIVDWVKFYELKK